MTECFGTTAESQGFILGSFKSAALCPVGIHRDGPGGENRTRTPRFKRPPLCQSSYARMDR